MIRDYRHERVVEPEKRMVGGSYGWAVHRFPIKNGKTRQETVVRELAGLIWDHARPRRGFFQTFIAKQKA